MDTIEILIFLAVILVIGWIWNMITGGIASQANKHVSQRGKHKKGQELMSTRIQFATNQAPPEFVRDAIARSILLEPRGMMKRTFELHVEQRSDSGWELIYTFGNKVAENFRTVVVITPGNGGVGSTGFIAVMEALQADGVMTHPNELAQWRQIVINAIGASDASAQFGEVPA